jgi:hypothetical protein
MKEAANEDGPSQTLWIQGAILTPATFLRSGATRPFSVSNVDRRRGSAASLALRAHSSALSRNHCRSYVRRNYRSVTLGRYSKGNSFQINGQRWRGFVFLGSGSSRASKRQSQIRLSWFPPGFSWSLNIVAAISSQSFSTRWYDARTPAVGAAFAICGAFLAIADSVGSPLAIFEAMQPSKLFLALGFGSRPDQLWT